MNLLFHELRNTCKYRKKFPDDNSDHCMAYSSSKRPDGLHWGHYPYCKYVNCPIVNEDLLEGATLHKEK